MFMSVFGVQNALEFVFFVRACFQVIFLSMSDSNFQCLGLPNRGFRIGPIAKNDFSWKLFLMHFGIGFLVVLCVGSRFRVMDFHVFETSKRRAPTNDKGPFNQILKVLDVRSISTREHEWNFGSMVPISTRKHEMAVR